MAERWRSWNYVQSDVGGVQSMCGIAGLLGTFDDGVLCRLSDEIAHRGPDGEGVWRDEQARIGLAHRRLSIIDLSPAASQPMVSPEGRYVTIFNGEIYNYRTLSGMLASKGYEFNPKSDTAVLAPLYDLEGPEMLQHLEGMYAFAIWDRCTRGLFVARDHAGIKPLYYSVTRNVLIFASELRAVRRALDSISADTDAIGEYLSFLWTPGERTLIREIKKLRPGHYLTAQLWEGRELLHRVTRWYVPPQAPIVDRRPVYDEAVTPDQLLKMLDDVVDEQCVSDVPIGAFLSGGVDSSAVVASMVATGNRPTDTYCIGFAGANLSSEGFDDDLGYARSVAAHFGVPLKEVVIEENEILDEFPGLAVLLEEPTADPAPILARKIAEHARHDNIKVLLSGVGGDDIFSGYRRHLAARIRERVGPLRSVVTAGASLVERISRGALSRRAAKLAVLIGARNDECFLLRAFAVNSIPDATSLLKTDSLRESSGSLGNALTEALAETRGQSLLNRMLYLELFGFLPDHNLNYTDKTCMTMGVEARVPLADRRILGLMSRVSPRLKTNGLNLKWFFKQALAGRLPAYVFTRRKVGFGAPIRKLFSTGKGRLMIEDMLFSHPMVAEHFHRRRLEQFWNETREQRVDGVYLAITIAMMGWIYDALWDADHSVPAPPRQDY